MNYWNQDDTVFALKMMRENALEWRATGSLVSLVAAMAHKASIRQRTVIPKLGDAYVRRCLKRAGH